jgi:hypothetical protein
MSRTLPPTLAEIGPRLGAVGLAALMLVGAVLATRHVPGLESSRRDGVLYAARSIWYAQSFRLALEGSYFDEADFRPDAHPTVLATAERAGYGELHLRRWEDPPRWALLFQTSDRTNWVAVGRDERLTLYRTPGAVTPEEAFADSLSPPSGWVVEADEAPLPVVSH